MAYLSLIHDQTLQELRNRYNAMSWISKLLFPSEIKQLIQVHTASSSSQRYGRLYYHSMYQSDDAWEFCERYQNLMSNTSIWGTIQHKLFDFLSAFNDSRLMQCWLYAQDKSLGKHGFSLLTSSDEQDEAIRRGLALVQEHDFYDEMLPNYTSDMLNFPYPEEYAQLLITLYRYGVIGHSKSLSLELQNNLLEYLSKNVDAIKNIKSSIEGIHSGLSLIRQIDLATILRLYVCDDLPNFVNAVNYLHTETFDAASNSSAIRSHPAYLKLMADHPSPQHMSEGLVALYKSHLCPETALIKDNETELNDIDAKDNVSADNIKKFFSADKIKKYGINVLRLYIHLYPKKLAYLMRKMEYAKIVDLKATAESLPDSQKNHPHVTFFIEMLPTFMQTEQRARQRFFDNICSYTQDLTDEKLMAIWDQIPDGRLSIRHMKSISMLFIYCNTIQFLDSDFEHEREIQINLTSALSIIAKECQSMPKEGENQPPSSCKSSYQLGKLSLFSGAKARRLHIDVPQMNTETEPNQLLI